MKTPALLALLLGLLAAADAISIANDDQVDTEAAADLDEDKRAQWMPTRELESQFAELVMSSIYKLVQEGRLSKSVLTGTAPEKRGRWQGFCFRKTRSGRFLPYICWKGGKK